MSWTEFRRKEVKIRKDRTCWGCQRPFPAGSVMWNTVGAWDNDGISSTYQCPTCEKIMREMTWEEQQYYDDGYEEGWVLNEIQNVTDDWREMTPEQYLEQFVVNQPQG